MNITVTSGETLQRRKEKTTDDRDAATGRRTLLLPSAIRVLFRAVPYCSNKLVAHLNLIAAQMGCVITQSDTDTNDIHLRQGVSNAPVVVLIVIIVTVL